MSPHLPISLSLQWDFENKLTSADIDNDSVADVTYQWDALGRRVGRDDGTAVTVFVQSGQQTIADYTSGTAAASPTYTYVYATYIDEPVLRGGTGGLRYYHRGQQYSVIAMTNGGGTITKRYAYDAYGTPTITDASGTTLTTSTENNRYTYTGREFDSELGLYHYRARMYDSIAGRFCSRDPIGFQSGLLNLYGYVGCQPLRWIDPQGTVRSSGLSVEIWPAADQSEIPGVGWIDVPLGEERNGLTLSGLRVSCGCKEECGHWSLDFVKIEIRIYILIDVDGILDDGGEWCFNSTDGKFVCGDYGHEQHHMRRMIETARSNLFEEILQPNTDGFGDGDAGKDACKSHCQKLEAKAKLLNDILGNESGHNDDELPEIDSEYPPFDHMPPPQTPMPNPIPDGYFVP